MDLSHASVAQLLLPVEHLDRAVAFQQTAFFRCGATLYFRVEDIHAVPATLQQRGVVFQVATHLVHRAPGIELWLSEFTTRTAITWR